MPVIPSILCILALLEILFVRKYPPKNGGKEK